MTKNNKLLLLIISSLLVVLLTACSSTSEKEQEQEQNRYIIKIGHAAAKEHFAQNSFEKFKELVESRSNGKITVEIHPASELGGEREMLEQFLLGDLTMMAPAYAPLEAVSKTVALWDLRII